MAEQIAHLEKLNLIYFIIFIVVICLFLVFSLFIAHYYESKFLFNAYTVYSMFSLFVIVFVFIMGTNTEEKIKELKWEQFKNEFINKEK